MILHLVGFTLASSQASISFSLRSKEQFIFQPLQSVPYGPVQPRGIKNLHLRVTITVFHQGAQCCFTILQVLLNLQNFLLVPKLTLKDSVVQSLGFCLSPTTVTHQNMFFAPCPKRARLREQLLMC